MPNWNLQFLVLDTSVGVVGVALVFWSRLLSEKYNALTTRLRTRVPNINPPPTPGMAQKNYKIMAILFRILGVLLFGGAVWAAWAAYATS